MLLDIWKNHERWKRSEKGRLEGKAECDVWRRKMEWHGLLEGVAFDPVLYTGTALELANKYGITLHKGTCYSQVRASLPKEAWHKPLNAEVCPFEYGTFAHVPADDCIYAFHGRVEMAICRCLVFAKIAGVI